MSDGRETDGDDWWRGAVIYQVYPRSFGDSNGDGIGDLPGIAERLEHVAALGVDAVWVSPFFVSPMKDYGYDVADYRTVDPMFGTLADFDALLEKAHGLGLKVMIDLVLSHTSDAHPWFRESRRDRTNAKASWYVWADPKEDGTPTTNWLSIFGGVAWEWEPRRGQYYLHNFLIEQPDLNLHEPEVVAALLDEAAFWLKRGVDGFRLDALDFFLHDPELRDNPPRGDAPLPGGLRAGTPYAMQRQTRSKAWRPIPDLVLRPLRALADRYPGTALLAELSGEGALERIGLFTRGRDGVHMAYSFDLLSCPLTPAGLRRVFDEVEPHLDDGWPCWSFGNHDVIRPVSRFGGDHPDPRLATLLPALLASLGGSVCLYQGEELGLPEADLAYEELRDPVGLTFWPEHKGRDGARTPMPWAREGDNAGFGAGRPWLPVPPEHRDLAVDAQEHDPASVLNRTRRFLAWRKTRPALIRGRTRFLPADDPVLAVAREAGGERVVAAFNLGPDEAAFRPGGGVEPLDGHGFSGEFADGVVRLPGYGAFFGA